MWNDINWQETLPHVLHLYLLAEHLIRLAPKGTSFASQARHLPQRGRQELLVTFYYDFKVVFNESTKLPLKKFPFTANEYGKNIVTGV